MKRHRSKLAWLFLAFATLGIPIVSASDHDDGETTLKGRELNLTDLYVFREDWQTTGGSKDNLVFIMNSNPRSVARQQYFFATNARYEFHVSRVADKTVRPKGSDDVVLRFEFAAPDSENKQAVTMTYLKDGVEVGTATTKTTNLTDSTKDTLTTDDVTIGGQTFKVFAGLREDPFFFDVECYFRVRNYLAASNTLAGSKNRKCFALDTTATAASSAVDFTAGYNINAIVVKVPIAALQSASEKSFDVWETISVKN